MFSYRIPDLMHGPLFGFVRAWKHAQRVYILVRSLNGSGAYLLASDKHCCHQTMLEWLVRYAVLMLPPRFAEERVYEQVQETSLGIDVIVQAPPSRLFPANFSIAHLFPAKCFARRSGVLGCSNDPKFSVEQVDAVEADALLLQFPAADKGPFALHGIEHSVITELPLGLRTYQAIAVTPLDVPKPNGRIWLAVALPD
jgi:hypothetical protein